MASDIAHLEPPPNWRRTRRLLAALAGVVIAALAYSVRADAIVGCLGTPEDIDRATVQVGNRNTPLTGEQIAALFEVQGESIWVGYENGAWAYPPGFKEMEFERYWIFGTRGGVKFWVILYVGAEWSYGFTFSNTDAYADAQGAHYGQHPCYAWETDGAAVVAVLTGPQVVTAPLVVSSGPVAAYLRRRAMPATLPSRARRT